MGTAKTGQKSRRNAHCLPEVVRRTRPTPFFTLRRTQPPPSPADPSSTPVAPRTDALGHSSLRHFRLAIGQVVRALHVPNDQFEAAFDVARRAEEVLVGRRRASNSISCRRISSHAWQAASAKAARTIDWSCSPAVRRAQTSSVISSWLWGLLFRVAGFVRDSPSLTNWDSSRVRIANDARLRCRTSALPRERAQPPSPFPAAPLRETGSPPVRYRDRPFRPPPSPLAARLLVIVGQTFCWIKPRGCPSPIVPVVVGVGWRREAGFDVRRAIQNSRLVDCCRDKAAPAPLVAVC
jgi:hypothetical protein